jgi:hypothetical protein
MSAPVTMLERRTQGVGGQPPLRLGEILVGRQALEQHRLEAALARQPESGRQLGDLLVANDGPAVVQLPGPWPSSGALILSIWSAIRRMAG